MEPGTGERWRDAYHFVRLVGGRWTLALLAELVESGHRYQELYDALDGISYKVLTEVLRRAERDGLIARSLDSQRVETTALYERPISVAPSTKC